jgi:hypothetical protein
MFCWVWSAVAMVVLPGAGAQLTKQQVTQQRIQVVVESELAGNANDHSQWIYLDDNRKLREHVVEWVASTPQGGVRRVLEREGQRLTESQQEESIERFLHNARAQKQEVAEADHDNRQVNDLLKLLPVAFVWTETETTETTTSFHFEPAVGFHPPTREARVFSGMAGDLVADNQSHRIVRMRGHLIHDVNFGGGLLGRLKEGSSFELEQQRVGGGYWELTGLHVHLQGNALLFKSVSLEEDDDRSRYEPEPEGVTLEQAAAQVMRLPEEVRTEVGSR